MSMVPGFRSLSCDGFGNDVFRRYFDSQPFLFEHSLRSDTLFGIPALQALAATLSMRRSEPGFLRVSDESLRPSWGTAELQKAVNDALEDIESSKMRLKLSAVHSEPGYREVLDNCSRELSKLTGIDLERRYCDARATIFVSSPYQITPYHIDREANFLLEVLGTKSVYIVDGNDRENLRWRDLEDYWHDGGLKPPEDVRSRARCFQLRPGLGLHNPVNFPHWVENGPSPSVTLSVGFKRVHNPVDVLQVNYYLRRLHLSPTPPGRSELRDMAKRAIVQCVRAAKGALARGRAIRPAE
jgi:hypothetical protein